MPAPTALLTAAVAGLAAALAWAGPASAQQARSVGCPAAAPAILECARVQVPIDRTGVVPGTIDLFVEVLRNGAVDPDRRVGGAPAPTRGVLFLVAGGPGQGGASSFGLDVPSVAAARLAMTPGYDLVAVDTRGTGRSSPIDCKGLQSAPFASPAGSRRLSAACGAQLGPAASLYSTADHAADLEAVRVALGFQQIGLFGVSYGTELALTYARTYGPRVTRLLLDSVAPDTGADPFLRPTLRAIPQKLASWCAAGRCASATKDFPGDALAVVRAAAKRPLEAQLATGGGSTRTVRADVAALLHTIVDLDLSDGVAAQAPAAFAAARAGRPAALVRLADVDARASAETPVRDLSAGLYLATTCRDGPFPWRPDAPPAERAAAFEAALAARPAAERSGFQRFARAVVDAEACAAWPGPSGGVLPVPGSFPDVPMLAISGGLDMRTPTSDAASVVRQFPQGRLLVDPGVGHNPTGADYGSECLADGLVAFLADRPLPRATCPRAAPGITPLGAYPARAPRRRLGPRATRRLALATVRDAGTIADVAYPGGDGFVVRGLAGGTLTLRGESVRLRDYALVAGVAVSGDLTTSYERPRRFGGTLRVSGRLATASTINPIP